MHLECHAAQHKSAGSNRSQHWTILHSQLLAEIFTVEMKKMDIVNHGAHVRNVM